MQVVLDIVVVNVLDISIAHEHRQRFFYCCQNGVAHACVFGDAAHDAAWTPSSSCCRHSSSPRRILRCHHHASPHNRNRLTRAHPAQHDHPLRVSRLATAPKQGGDARPPALSRTTRTQCCIGAWSPAFAALSNTHTAGAANRRRACASLVPWPRASSEGLVPRVSGPRASLLKASCLELGPRASNR